MRNRLGRSCAIGVASDAYSIESLESRTLLSAAVAGGSLPTLVPIRWKTHHTFAAAGHWIMTLSRAHAADLPSQIGPQLSRKHFHMIRSLGAGSFLIGGDSSRPINKVRSDLRSSVAGFHYVQPDTVIQTQSMPNDPGFTLQWGLHQTSAVDISAPAAWDISTGNRTVVTAVVDTGVDYTHPDLAANIWTNPGEIPGDGIDNDSDGFVDDVHGWDFANGDSDPMDDNGHGTMIAGTIAAVGNNADGVTGINWQGSIMPLKFIRADGSGMTSNAVACLNYVVMMRTRYNVNVRVVNASWISGYSAALQIAIDTLNTNDILFIAGAGNGGADSVGDNDDTSPVYPASLSASNIITVTATDGNDQLAGFANYGPTTVDLAAPGVNIYTTAPGNTYGWSTGTSDAAPFVAGVAALAFAAAPLSTGAQVKAAIINGVDPIATLAGKCVSGGRLNAWKTLSLLVPPSTGTGLSVTYFDNKNFTGTSSAASATLVNYNWGTAAPVQTISSDTFSARFVGQVQPQYTETYTFYSQADDGVKVWVNNQLLISRWSDRPSTGDLNGDGVVNSLDFNGLASNFGGSGPSIAPFDITGDGFVNSQDFTILAANFGSAVLPVENSGSIALQSGQKYDLRVDYYDDAGVASIKLLWSSPSTPKSLIPTNHLYVNVPPLPSEPEQPESLFSESLIDDSDPIKMD